MFQHLNANERQGVNFHWNSTPHSVGECNSKPTFALKGIFSFTGGKGGKKNQ